MSPFDFVNAICQTKENLLVDEQSIKEYRKCAYIVNGALSYFHDTVHQANAMNMNSHIPPEWQFQFLLNSITKKKRFAKWQKKDSDTASLLLVKEYYGYSSDKAKEALAILSDEQLKFMEQKLQKGGK